MGYQDGCLAKVVLGTKSTFSSTVVSVKSTTHPGTAHLRLLLKQEPSMVHYPDFLCSFVPDQNETPLAQVREPACS